MFFLKPISRRRFFSLAGAAGAGLAVSGCSGAKVEPGTAIEFLNSQHGILRRAVAILEEIRGVMDARMELPPETIQGTVEVVRRLIIDHHQKMEEKYIYPAFDSAKKMGGLVGVLREQHAAGAQLTEILGKLAAGFSTKDLEDRRTMQNAIHKFSRMYRAHADREDTLLFPAVRRIVSPAAFAKLNEAFHKDDKQFLGQNGFDEAVQKLAGLENALGIGDLAAFTPRMEELS